MKKNYIYANIRLPIEITEDGSLHEMHCDRMTIEFELCETLPEKDLVANEEMLAKIFAIHPKTEVPGQDNDNCMKILKREYNNRRTRTRLNHSFRNREGMKKVKKITQRVYSTNSNTSGDDPIPLPALSV